MFIQLKTNSFYSALNAQIPILPGAQNVVS
jgi:hypothetical protein